MIMSKKVHMKLRLILNGYIAVSISSARSSPPKTCFSRIKERGDQKNNMRYSQASCKVH
jgi:hypothetical protein